MASAAATQVGTYFLRNYYNLLQQNPDVVHQFYSDASTMVRVDDLTGTNATANTMEKGYFVLNDYFHFVDQEQVQPAPVIAQENFESNLASNTAVETDLGFLPTPLPMASAAATQVGTYFLRKYYNLLQQTPDVVHQFYSDASTMVRVDDLTGTNVTANTMVDIHSLIMSLNFTQIEIKTANFVNSWGDGVLVMASGLVQTREYNHQRKFLQMFFLAPEEKGYFVLNDYFHFVDQEQVQPAPVIAQENFESTLASNTRSFLERLEVDVPSTRLADPTRRGSYMGQSSSPTRSDTFPAQGGEDDDEDEVEQTYDEIGPSQLVDAPSTQPSQPLPRRRRREPSRYTPGTDALGKGKGKARR